MECVIFVRIKDERSGTTNIIIFAIIFIVFHDIDDTKSYNYVLMEDVKGLKNAVVPILFILVVVIIPLVPLVTYSQENLVGQSTT